MRSLLLDFGNTRMKSVLVDGERMGEIVPFTYAGQDPAVACAEALSAYTGIDQCVMASVKGDPFDAAFSSALKKRLGVAVRKITVADNDLLTLAYEQPTRLGIDRLLNMLGAKSLGVENALVVSAGTAVTFDGFEGGVHLGGCISPGRGMMGDALDDRTSLIKARPSNVEPNCFGTSTEQAVTAGVELAYAGGVRHIIVTMLEQMPQSTRLILTGGDAEWLSSRLGLSFDVESNLLFRGLLRFTR